MIKYHTGTPAEHAAFEAAAKISAGIPAEGKINYRNRKLDPTAPRTMNYCKGKDHLTDPNKCYWEFGAYADGSLAQVDSAALVTGGYIEALEVPE